MTEPVGNRTPSLLVFSDDWGRHPSSCQHLIRHMLPRYRVRWVNTIGMRRPGFDRVALSRAFEKLKGWLYSPNGCDRQLTDPRVLNPRMWPWFSRRHDRWLNRILLLRQLVPVIESSPSPVTAVTTVPIVADLLDQLPVARWVYYCVDDFTKWPGLDGKAIAEMEEELACRADVLIAASEKLRERLVQHGRKPYLLTHGVDLEHWKSNGQSAAVPQFEGMERPLVLFWGLIDWQMDVSFLRRLASDLRHGTIVLVGPETDPDPALHTIPRLVRVPKVPYEELPRMAQSAAVLVMPYTDGPALQASQPLKLKEYLASGKPVVVRDLPATRLWADALDLAGSAEEFSKAVRRRLRDGLPSCQSVARQRLEKETWDQKSREFEHMALEGVCGQRVERSSDAR